MPRLVSLDLSGCGLVILPPAIGSARLPPPSQLKVLLLARNALSRVPLELGRLRRLEKLDLSDNKLEELPEQV